MKIAFVFGTRPEAIKLAPILREMKERAYQSDLKSVVCVTAQHRQMLDQVLDLFGIVPDYDLAVMEHNQTPSQVASGVLAKLEYVLKREELDWVVVQGDTTTVAAAALASFYNHTKVAHVEAGLRTYDKWRPFPEEINRRIAGSIADLHFPPTEGARQNLVREGVPEGQILVTGNPVIDAVFQIAALPAPEGVKKILFDLDGASTHRHLVLVTAHRRENLGEPLNNICLAIKDIAEKYGDQVQVVYPVHMNPSVQETAFRLLDKLPNVSLIPPLDYLSLIHLLKRTYLVLTDSGGIQEEAPSLGVPVLVLREVTERPEAVDAGTVRLVGTDRELIVAEASSLLNNPMKHHAMSKAINPYGDGQASRRIVSALQGDFVDSFVAQMPRERMSRGSVL